MAEPIPAPAPAPHPPHAEHRCYFQELFFDMVLKRNSALPGASAEREVYIVEGFILPGTRPGRAIAPLLPRGDQGLVAVIYPRARRSITALYHGDARGRN